MADELINWGFETASLDSRATSFRVTLEACPVVQTCGGCPLLAVTTEQERAFKAKLLSQLSFRLGHDDAESTLFAAKARIDYRNRIRLRIDDGGRVAFFNTEKSPSCAVLEPPLREYVNHLREWSRLNPHALEPCAYLEARTRDRDGSCGLLLTLKPEASLCEHIIDRLSSSYDRQRIATNHDAILPTQRFDIDERTFQRVPLDGFLQVNLEVNRLLTRHVVQGATARGARTFADLYCGSGNFALPLARAGLEGTGVEWVASSILAAKQAALEQELLGLSFEHQDSIEFVRDALVTSSNFDLLLLDPPRAGIRSGLDSIAELARHSIAYCSCNPGTLERDLLLLLEAGWRLEQLTGFDMFPGTHHVEVVAWLAR